MDNERPQGKRQGGKMDARKPIAPPTRVDDGRPHSDCPSHSNRTMDARKPIAPPTRVDDGRPQAYCPSHTSGRRTPARGHPASHHRPRPYYVRYERAR